MNPGHVARDFGNAASDMQPYRLHPEAFFTSDQNLRMKRLDELFHSVAIDNVSGWINQHPALVDYRDNHIGDGNTVLGELEEFIQARNDAAHGGIGEHFGISKLLQLTQFVECLGTALVEKARHDMYSHFVTGNRAEKLGDVVHVYGGAANAVIVNATTAFELVVGEPVGLLTNTSCDYQEVVSCQVDDVDVSRYVAVAGQELGLRFASLPRKGTQLMRVVPYVPPEENGGAFI